MHHSVIAVTTDPSHNSPAFFRVTHILTTDQEICFFSFIGSRVVQDARWFFSKSESDSPFYVCPLVIYLFSSLLKQLRWRLSIVDLSLEIINHRIHRSMIYSFFVNWLMSKCKSRNERMNHSRRAGWRLQVTKHSANACQPDQKNAMHHLFFSERGLKKKNLFNSQSFLEVWIWCFSSFSRNGTEKKKTSLCQPKIEFLNNKLEDSCGIIKKAFDQIVQSTLQNLENDSQKSIESISTQIDDFKYFISSI
jgi:hypothetical protein